MQSEAEKLLAMAERVEALTGPDRKTDYLIFCECVPLGERAYWEPDNRENHFTASLDAAMGLAPDQWMVSRFQELWRTKCWTAQLSPRPTSTTPAAFDAGRTIGWEMVDCISGATAALALTAAALRARAALATENPHD